MFNDLLYNDLLEHAKQESLPEFVLDVLYNAQSEVGDRSMIGICPGFVYVNISDEDEVICLDDTGNELFNIDSSGFISELSNEDYVIHKDELAKLCDKLQLVIDAEKVIFLD